MSINVTVTGNPVSINRGKMVTADPNYAKNEFEKRRLMRLEQVRQQSKDIAESVRNKVRKEKRKQMKKIEEEGREKLKDWQNRKLLQLQTQYKEALQEFGVGHKEAETVALENDIAEDIKEHNEQASLKRGQDAEIKLQAQRHSEYLKKAIPLQRKKLTRDVENSRATLVSGIKETKISSSKKRKPVANIDISVPASESRSQSESDSDSQISLKIASSLQNQKNAEISSCTCSEELEKPRSPLKMDKLNLNIPEDEGAKSLHHEFSSYTAPPINIPAYTQETEQSNSPLDTRISDRIKRRNLTTYQSDFSEIREFFPVVGSHKNQDVDYQLDSLHNIHHRTSTLQNKDRQCNCEKNVEFSRGIRSNVNNVDKENIPFSETNTHICPCAVYNTLCPCLKANYKNKETANLASRDLGINGDSFETYQKEIPSRPPVKLKQRDIEVPKTSQFTQTSLATKESSKVQFYDHSNRFSGEKQVPTNSYVERITADSLEVIPNEISEAELNKKMLSRERDAQLRGQRALRKDRIQKDYDEMLKKLPLLQKKERIAEIKKDKPEYHMSNERLKEVERKRQNQMDNTYNKLFPNLKPAIVTLPSKRQQQTEIPVTDISSGHTRDVGKWDVDYGEPKIFTAQEVQDIVKAFTGQNSSERRTKLKELLKHLKLQKEQLIDEIKLLPQDNSLNELINDINSVDSTDYMTQKINKKSKRSEKKRRRIDDEKDAILNSTVESSCSSSSSDEKKRRQKALSRRYKIAQLSPSSHKKTKKKSKQKVIILQNTSTQTTPKITTSEKIKSDEKTEEQNNEGIQSLDNVCSKLHVPCDCKLTGNLMSEELCQILIKLGDKEPPEVIVKPKESVKTSPQKPTGKEFRSVAVGTNSVQALEKKSRRLSKPEDIHDVIIDKNERKRFSETKQKSGVIQITKGKTDDKEPIRTKSWKEQLSKNSISTSSTSYMSPPDFQKTKDKTDPSKVSFYNLSSKPQQKNITDFDKMSTSQENQEDKLSFYIKKLLSMSKASLENLNVSSVSSAPTPSQSVIEIESNNPQAELQNLIKYYSNFDDIAHQLSYSPDYESMHYNTSASSSQKSLDKKQPDILTDQVPEKDDSDNPKETLLQQYEDITDSCSKRIANLAAMIKQIREEKMQMLQIPLDPEDMAKCICPSPINSDKDISTAYMDLPDVRESGSNGSSKQSSSSSFDEEDMLRKLIDIDLNLAKKLRSMNQQSSKPTNSSHKRDILAVAREFVDPNEMNQEILGRLERLKREPAASNTRDMRSSKEEGEEPAFVSFLSDIPKLPKFAPELENENSNNNHKRPPPSRGLIIAKKFNENISLVPHELSTIVEADSQLSARAPSPNTSKHSFSSLKDVELVVIPRVQEKLKQSPTEAGRSKRGITANKDYFQENFKLPLNEMVSELGECDDLTCKKLISESLSKMESTTIDVSKFESTSSEDIESIEAMLKSIGMEWAIPTIHKTQEALALTSSSSSSGYSAKIKIGNDSTGKDLSLRGFLQTQLLNKISSSTFISDTSPVSMLGEFSDLSSRQASLSSLDKNQRQTSTPVTTSKSTSKSKDILLYSGESDISSVKKESSDNISK